MRSKIKTDSESYHQQKVVKWLKDNEFDFFAVPNGYRTSFSQAKKAKAEGLQSGVPDILILNKCSKNKPVALEMKKYKGAKHKIPCNCLEQNQVVWKEKFEANGWVHILAHGYEDAIAKLILIYLH